MAVEAKADEGKTEVPEDSKGANECMGRYRHRWEWVWVAGVWTNKVRCCNCNEEKVNEK